MNKDIFISSTQNTTLKYLKKLKQNSRTRRQDKCFVVEGYKELNFALEKGYFLKALFSPKEDNIFSCDKKYILDANCWQSVCYRSSSEVLAILAMPNHNILPIFLEDSIYLVCDDIEKPSNIGAILRTADAIGIKGVFITALDYDLYNPNIIKSSVGCVFTIPIYLVEKGGIKVFLETQGVNIFVATPEATTIYTQIVYPSKVALVVGSEHNGVSDFWKNTALITSIPMNGHNDSLNVSVSTAVILYEILRQKFN